MVISGHGNWLFRNAEHGDLWFEYVWQLNIKSPNLMLTLVNYHLWTCNQCNQGIPGLIMVINCVNWLKDDETWRFMQPGFEPKMMQQTNGWRVEKTGAFGTKNMPRSDSMVYLKSAETTLQEFECNLSMCLRLSQNRVVSWCSSRVWTLDVSHCRSL